MKHIPRKRFGQNFLHDSSVIDRIVRAVAPKAGQKLVEIGPGLGALTLPILQQLGQLQVVELDRDLIPKLEALCADQGELIVHSADALKFDFAALCDENEKLRLVGNLPYNISTPLIFHLLQSVERIHDMHFMLQYEVVQRMAASPGGRDYGRLSVMCQYYCQVHALFTVRPGAFNPPPKVNSAIVRLTPHQEPLVEVGEVELFAKVVRQAFSQRRKTLRNTLRPLLSAEAIVSCDIDPSLRAESLSLAQFASLSRYYSEHL